MNAVTSPAGTSAQYRGRQLFGQGAHEPYACALHHGLGTLTLRPQTEGSGIGPVHFKVQDWCGPASSGEVALLRSSRGPVLDAGCGPGRMLAAASALGLIAVGVDTSIEAVTRARSRGAMALNLSIFDPLPYEGFWGTALLLDGNIGIGGDVPSLLRRVAQLVRADGSVLVEVDPLEALDISYRAVLHGAGSRPSEAFPWSRVGSTALACHAAAAGWRIVKTSIIDSTSRPATNVTCPAGRKASTGSAGAPTTVVEDRLVCRLVRRI
ncbi:methyltransferase domain-containing protein [Paenarthrobacter sp. PH39-S1]|uniref:class I SAM-dependent methyltransferase n=1 Tax=Paenarthrobacter sp. PH39-S1 TaxID=3046204 RepID=UPI0024B91DA0|nr:methyltransferase domain-containing protein [Paenarthrobacter sp. PH39-S1]MDJ0355241.1 methyltransferase domain-containing protein [Paenarthrobacter sp. PH39-S1]